MQLQIKLNCSYHPAGFQRIEKKDEARFLTKMPFTVSRGENVIVIAWFFGIQSRN